MKSIVFELLSFLIWLVYLIVTGTIASILIEMYPNHTSDLVIASMLLTSVFTNLHDGFTEILKEKYVKKSN